MHLEPDRIRTESLGPGLTGFGACIPDCDILLICHNIIEKNIIKWKWCSIKIETKKNIKTFSFSPKLDLENICKRSFWMRCFFVFSGHFLIGNKNYQGTRHACLISFIGDMIAMLVIIETSYACYIVFLFGTRYACYLFW